MEIPQVVIDRLPLYTRALTVLESEGRQVVSSLELGQRLGITPAQIRKDLSYFGRFGKQGRGYNVYRLVEELRQILGLEHQWQVALVGVGRLGHALLGYDGFTKQGFRFTEAFDNDKAIIGQKVANLVVKDVSKLETALTKTPVDIGIVAVPELHAQDVTDSMVGCGIQAILNYTSVPLLVPKAVQVKRIDPVLSLQGMTYYLKAKNTLIR